MELIITFAVGLLVSGYQVWRCFDYLKRSIRKSHNYSQKIEQGTMQLWEYVFLFVPIRYRDYYDSVGLQGGNFYLTPLVGFLALWGNPIGWVGVLLCVLLSLGGGVFKLVSPLMLRLPFYWGYFASLGIVALSVQGLRFLSLNNHQLIIFNIILALLLLFNRQWLPVYPYNMWTKLPSQWFDTLLLRYLERNARGFRVNNLPYPAYHGQVNHIKSMGYMGGNHLKEMGEFREIDPNGAGGYNWFDYAPDSEKLNEFGVKFHIGDRPSDNPKWVRVKGFDNLWENTEVCENARF